MDLTFNGSYGYDGEDVRAFAEIPDPVSGVQYAQPRGTLSPRAFALSHFMTLEEREAMILGAYPRLRGDPHHDRSARR